MPPAMTNPVPTTGTATKEPGYTVEAPNMTAEKPIAPSPTQVITPPTSLGRRSSQWVPTHTRAPSASSHARVKGEKYARVGLTFVWITENVNETMMIRTRPTASRARSESFVRSPAMRRNTMG